MRTLGAACFGFVILWVNQADTQEPIKKPAVRLTLTRVRGEEFFSVALDGPMKGKKVRDVILDCDVVIDNQTGEDLTVLSNFFSPFDGLEIVLLKEGKELRSQSYISHQSPMAEKRPYVLKRGTNKGHLSFPINAAPAEWASLEAKITGYLPASKFKERLISETKKIQPVVDLRK